MSDAVLTLVAVLASLSVSWSSSPSDVAPPTGRCGLLCVALCAELLDVIRDEEQLQKLIETPVSDSGTSLLTLSELASVYGMQPRMIECDVDLLLSHASARTPAVIKMTSRHHFLVTTGLIGSQHVKIYDPVSGNRTVITVEAFEELFSGYAMLLSVPGTTSTMEGSTEKPLRIWLLMGALAAAICVWASVKVVSQPSCEK